MNASTPNVSFIGIVDFSQEARWLYMTPSVTELLGYEPGELIGQPSLNLVHPDEFPQIRKCHYDTIQQDKAAVLVYIRMRHKDPYRGFVLCAVSRTVVHNVLVGSVSFASPAKALQNASTAQEVEVITPSAATLSFRRWHDPSPMPPCPIPASMLSIPDELFSKPTSATAPSASSSWVGKGSSSSPPRISESPRMARPSEAYHFSGNGTANGASSRSPSTASRLTISRSPSPSNSNPHTQAHAYSQSSPASPGSRNGCGSLIGESGPPSVTRSSSGSSRGSSTSTSCFDASMSPSMSTSATSINVYDDSVEKSSPSPQAREQAITFNPLSNKSFRTALILDRFTIAATILYCSNDLLISTTDAIGRSIYDFVAENDEEKVKSWIQCVKGWGVNEKGQPSDGGFGFGKFTLLAEGRDSVKRMPEPPTPSRKSNNTKRGSGRYRDLYTTRHGSRYRGDSTGSKTLVSSRVAPPPPAPNTSSLYDVDQFEVDSIFSAHSDGLIVILRRASAESRIT